MNQNSEVASHARKWVVVFAITLAIISYVDRVLISQAKESVIRDFALSELQWTWILTTFSLAYALFEVPGGWMGDRWGARKALIRVVGLWSFFVAATAWAWNFSSLLVCRFLFGVGEAGCFPNIAKMFSRWLPSDERVRAQGIMWLAARWGASVTPAIVAFLLLHLHWRRVFELFALLGIVWVIIFARWFCDDPSAHASVNLEEKKILPVLKLKEGHRESTPWASIFGNRSALLLCLQYFLLAIPWWFYLQRLPNYLRENPQFSSLGSIEAAALAGLPLFFGGIGCWAGGYFARPLALRLGGVPRMRKTVCMCALSFAGAMFLLSTYLNNPYLVALVFGLASFANDLTMANSWGSCMDIGGRHTGVVSGVMNSGGAFGGAVSALLVGYILEWCNKDWNVAFIWFFGIYLLAASCWLFIDSVSPIEESTN